MNNIKPFEDMTPEQIQKNLRLNRKQIKPYIENYFANFKVYNKYMSLKRHTFIPDNHSMLVNILSKYTNLEDVEVKQLISSKVYYYPDIKHKLKLINI